MLFHCSVFRREFQFLQNKNSRDKKGSRAKKSHCKKIAANSCYVCQDIISLEKRKNFFSKILKICEISRESGGWDFFNWYINLFNYFWVPLFFVPHKYLGKFHLLGIRSWFGREHD